MRRKPRGLVHRLVALACFAWLVGAAAPPVRAEPPPGIEWVRQFGTSEPDWAYAVSVDGTGVYVAGLTYGSLRNYTARGLGDAFVRKYMFDQTEAWTLQFGTPGTDAATDVIADGTNVYVAGVKGADVFVRKVDTNGAEVWVREFRAAASGVALAVEGKAVYLAGQTCGELPGQRRFGVCDAFVRKYTIDGTEVWTRQFGTTDSTGLGAATGVAVSDSGLFVSGYVSDALPSHTNLGGYDAFVRMYDFDGKEAWTRQFGTQEDERAVGIAANAWGTYVASWRGLADVGSELRSFDLEGNERWTLQLGPDILLNDIAADAVGFYVVGVLTVRSGSGFPTFDAIIQKYDSDGNDVWTVSMDGGPLDNLFGIELHPTGLYVAGRTDGALPGQKNAGGSDAFVAKLGSVTQPGVCPLSQGYWKTHGETWPTWSLVLGDETYDQRQLLGLLTTPPRGDASLLLAHQLVAAKLNAANGSDDAPIASTIADADALLSAFGGRLPYGVRPSTSIGQRMVRDAELLDGYNSGQFTPNCETGRTPNPADPPTDVVPSQGAKQAGILAVPLWIVLLTSVAGAAMVVVRARGKR